MHIVMIIDAERILHEHPMINGLTAGLVDAGCTVTRIVPAKLDPQIRETQLSATAVAKQISVPLKVLPWLRRPRLEQVTEAMPRPDPDVVYGWGQETWSLAMGPVQTIRVSGGIGTSGRLILLRPCREAVPRRRLAPTSRHADRSQMHFARFVDPSLVSYVPQGVTVPETPGRVFADQSRPIAMTIVGSGRDLLSYRAMLSGISRVMQNELNLHAVLELRGPQHHEIWRHARRLELLGNISAITDAARFRTLLVHCDMLVLPERFGEIRSLTLEAMAMGIPVVAADDPVIDFLIADETALIVTEAEADSWATQLRKLLSSQEFSQQLGMAGRRFVQQHHSLDRQVNTLLETLKRAVHGENDRLHTQTGGPARIPDQLWKTEQKLAFRSHCRRLCAATRHLSPLRPVVASDASTGFFEAGKRVLQPNMTCNFACPTIPLSEIRP